jgi:AAA family ATP:ADP antiporter
MLKIIKQTFNIQEGELRLTLLMQLYIFLVISVLLIVKPTVTALFLANLGAGQLPYAYLLVAVVAVLTSLLYTQLVRRFTIRSISIFTLVLFSVFFFLLGYVIHFHVIDPWILYFYYLSLSIFGVLVTSQFWIIANLAFDAREAKRLFGFIGAGAIAGGIFGGYLTSIVTNFFGNGVVMLIASGLLLSCIPIILAVWKIRIRRIGRLARSKRNTEKTDLSNSNLKLILRSKHLTNMAAIVGISVLVAKLIDYQFSEFSHRVYPDSNDLASFFGFWFSSFNVIAIIIQLFLTNRLLAFFGVATNMLFLPLGLALGSLLFLIFPELWVVVLLKGVDGSFKQSINKASFELSILPVSFETKKRAKPFIDVVVDSIATGAAGFVLLFVVRRLNVPAEYITIIVILFLFAWLFFISRLRETFFDSFRKNILATVGKREEGGINIDKEETDHHGSTIEILDKGSEAEVLSLLDNFNDPMLQIYKPYILNLLWNPSDRIKAAAIRAIYNFPYGTAVAEIRKILESTDDDEVVYEAMAYLLFHTSADEDEVFKSYLDHPKDYIRDAALVCLARSARHNDSLALKYGLNERIERQIEEFEKNLESHRQEEVAELLMTIGLSGNRSFYHFIDRHLLSENEFISKYAIRAAGLTMEEDFVSKLLELMGEERNLDQCIEVLNGYGDHLSSTLLEINRKSRIPDRVAKFIPQIIDDFDTEGTFRLLTNLLNRENVRVRLEAARSLAVFEENYPKYRIGKKYLIQYISKECDQIRLKLGAMETFKASIERMANKDEADGLVEIASLAAREELISVLTKEVNDGFKTLSYILSYKYANSDIEVATLGLINGTRESKINTVEFLDNLLEPALKNKIIPLLEYHFLENSKTGDIPGSLSEEEVLKRLREIQDDQITRHLNAL